jgi:hypothetical protein
LIGTRAVLQDLIPLGVLVVMGLIVSAILVSREKWWKNGGVWALLALFVFLSYTYLTGIVAGLSGFHFLKTLRPETLQSITVDGHTIAEESTISVISSSLRSVRWFSSAHDGWAKEVPLRFRLKNGSERTFWAAFYLRKHGAVIRGMFGNVRIHRSYDCGFNAELPDVLARLNLPLPTSR